MRHSARVQAVPCCASGGWCAAMGKDLLRGTAAGAMGCYQGLNLCARMQTAAAGRARRAPAPLATTRPAPLAAAAAPARRDGRAAGGAPRSRARATRTGLLRRSRSYQCPRWPPGWASPK
jgi:hypothetical protein